MPQSMKTSPQRRLGTSWRHSQTSRDTSRHLPIADFLRAIASRSCTGTPRRIEAPQLRARAPAQGAEALPTFCPDARPPRPLSCEGTALVQPGGVLHMSSFKQACNPRGTTPSPSTPHDPGLASLISRQPPPPRMTCVNSTKTCPERLVTSWGHSQTVPRRLGTSSPNSRRQKQPLRRPITPPDLHS